jgi:bifunctional non-homologous end joining protein LigD
MNNRPARSLPHRPAPLALPEMVAPMRAVRAAAPFDSPAHIFEVLWDGIRALVFIEGGRVRVQDAWGRDISSRFPELQGLEASVRDDGVVLDGRIAALDGRGRPDFGLLLPRLREEPSRALEAAKERPVTFHAFDILYRQGEPVVDLPLARRKELLRYVTRPLGPLAVPDFVEEDGIAFFEAAREHGLPGIVAKERYGTYEPGRVSRTWQAIRVYQRDEFVIGGFTYGGRLLPGAQSKRRRRPFASLLLGLFAGDGALRFVGEVTGGFEALEEHAEALDELVTEACPFRPEPDVRRLVFWCRPALCASVRYGDRAPDGTLRFPVFEALRPDVPAESCRME